MNRLHHLPLLATTALATAVLVGCAGRQGTNTVTLGPDDEGTEAVSINVTDSQLAKTVRVVDINAFEGVGSTLVFQAQLENRSRRPQAVAYQWVWSEGGYELPEGAEGARVYNLEPGEIRTVEGTAPNPRVDRATLKLNRPN
jgi:hypothetical protein